MFSHYELYILESDRTYGNFIGNVFTSWRDFASLEKAKNPMI